MLLYLQLKSNALQTVLTFQFTAKPGMVIGKGGSEVENLRKELNKLTGKRVHINIVEIKNQI